MLKFSVPFNWCEDFLVELKELHLEGDLYAKLPADFVGGGKHSFQVPSISRAKIKNYIKRIHNINLKFNYLLNSTCLGNLEWTRYGQRNIIKLLDWLLECEVDAVTVATPYLLQLVKKRFPRLKVNLSVLAGVNSLLRAKYWEDLGADRITLLNTDVNRNFELIKKIRDNVKCELQLIANVNCLYKCPMYFYHNSLSSHSSQSWHPTRGFVIDYCRLKCRYQQLLNPLEVIRSQWIRPEDIHHYEAAGINYLKLIDRGMVTEALVIIVKAYIKRHYDGNLLDLFPNPTKTIVFQSKNFLHKFKYFFRPNYVNIFKLIKMSRLFGEIFYIDNRKLDGFIEHFLNNFDCGAITCDECGYCMRVAENIVIIDKDKQKEMTGKYEECLLSLTNGGMFR